MTSSDSIHVQWTEPFEKEAKGGLETIDFKVYWGDENLDNPLEVLTETTYSEAEIQTSKYTMKKLKNATYYRFVI